jgi:hypothetical protein
MSISQSIFQSEKIADQSIRCYMQMKYLSRFDTIIKSNYGVNTKITSMLIPRIIRRIRRDQQYSLIANLPYST